MQRPTFTQLLLALFAGAVLLWLATLVGGFLAALPTPTFLRSLAKGQSWLWITAHSLLVFHIPMALAAAVFALATFRLIRARSLFVAAALSTPWLVYCVVEAVNYYNEAQFSPSQKLALLLAWYTWFGRLSVPLGVWAAHRLSSPATGAA